MRRPILVLSFRARSAEMALEMHRVNFPPFSSDRATSGWAGSAYLSEEDQRTEIDAVLIGHKGAFIIEVKNTKRNIFIDHDGSYYRTGQYLRFDSNIAERLHSKEELLKRALSNAIFTNPSGGYLSYRTVYDCFKRVMVKLGHPEARFHDLRHTYAVAAIKSGDDIKTVQENPGHATAAFTLYVYGHVTSQMKQASASRMEQCISAVSS